jgi:hypothetical protein
MHDSRYPSALENYMRSNWPWWRIAIALVAICLTVYSMEGRGKRAEQRAKQQRQEQVRHDVREVQELLPRDSEAGGNSGQTLRELLGEPEPPAPQPTAVK